MRKLLLIGGLVAAASIPLAAQAETRCERVQQNNQAAGAIAGAIGGAIIGSQLAGHGSRTEGSALGAVGGAIVGSQIAKGGRCPDGYRAYDTETRRYVEPTAVVVAPGGDYRGEFWRGAPGDISQRINFMETRIRAGRDDGTLTRREFTTAQDDLKDIRYQQENLRRRDHGLSPADRDYLQSRLDTLGTRVRWMRNNDNARRRY